MLGVEVGNYTQITNNLHVYLDKANFPKWLEDTTDMYDTWDEFSYDFILKPSLIGSKDSTLEYEYEVLENLIQYVNKGTIIQEQSHFVSTVVAPAVLAYKYHKNGRAEEAIRAADGIKSDDWRLVCLEWLYRRNGKGEE
jgi:hypothetical protein